MSNRTLQDKIANLKQHRNAVIMAHNYQRDEVQDIADFTGDSLALSRKAACTDAEVIVFCGVHFMAETAAILCPGKTVLLPDQHAGCPMAEMITAEQLRELKKKHPRARVLAYVNTSAAVKAESDICCTSSNAVAVVQSMEDAEEIIFVPDKYLAEHVHLQTGRDFIIWNGYCPTHIKIQPTDILRQKEIHPDAQVVVHPECSSAVTSLADKILSTEGICRYAAQRDALEFIVGTEEGILHRLRKENPQKIFYPVSGRAVCPNMKRTKLEDVLWALEQMDHVVTVPDSIRRRAEQAVARMVEVP